MVYWTAAMEGMHAGAYAGVTQHLETLGFIHETMAVNASLV